MTAPYINAGSAGCEITDAKTLLSWRKETITSANFCDDLSRGDYEIARCDRESKRIAGELGLTRSDLESAASELGYELDVRDISLMTGGK